MKPTAIEISARLKLDTESELLLAQLIEQGARQELASLGGHLLSVYGQDYTQPIRETEPTVDGWKQHEKDGPPQPHPLATLGGYLTEHYSQPAGA